MCFTVLQNCGHANAQSSLQLTSRKVITFCGFQSSSVQLDILDERTKRYFSELKSYSYMNLLVRILIENFMSCIGQFRAVENWNFIFLYFFQILWLLPFGIFRNIGFPNGSSFRYRNFFTSKISPQEEKLARWNFHSWNFLEIVFL